MHEKVSPCHFHTEEVLAKHIDISKYFERSASRYSSNIAISRLALKANRRVNRLSSFFKVLSGHHSENEILMVWKQTFKPKGFPWTDFTVLMRTKIYLTPADAKGVQKIKRFEEQWGENEQLNEDTTFWAVGRLHSMWRRFLVPNVILKIF